jgi:hypothetical protein
MEFACGGGSSRRNTSGNMGGVTRMEFACGGGSSGAPVRTPSSPLPMASMSIVWPRERTKRGSAAVSAPDAAARVVVIADRAASARWRAVERPAVEPQLKPYHPTHKSITPPSTLGTLCGTNLEACAASHRRARGPTTAAPTRAATPPTRCTTPEPAKSINGGSSCWSQPSLDHARRTATAYTPPLTSTERHRYASTLVRSAIAPDTMVAAVA